jgi:hypothetical protein
MRTYPIGMGAAQMAALALASLVACSNTSTGPADTADAGGSCSPCSDDDAGTTATAGTNPDGIPYPVPAGGYGRTARSGSTPGSVIQNFKFLGYPALTGDGTHPATPTTIALADYYDPCNKRYKVLHLSVAGVWCVPCNEETTAVVTDLQSSTSVLSADRVVFVQALDDGAVEGTPATQSDLDYWVTSHDSNFTEMLDPGLANLGGFFNAAAIPWNCDIDPRTMEIIDSSVGWAGDVTTEIAPGLSGLPASPSYPIPASARCN